MKIGILGAGNMGRAMLTRAAEVFGKEQMCFTDASAAAREKVAAETGVQAFPDNRSLVEAADLVVFAVKPQILPAVLPEIADCFQETSADAGRGKIILSIVAGVTIGRIREGLEKAAAREEASSAAPVFRIVRAMPNTPALVGEGMVGYCFEDPDLFTEEEKELVKKFFMSFGRAEEVSEKLLSAVTAVSGSSPAYVYMFIEALADSGVRAGLTYDKAITFAAQAVLGSAKMVLETGIHPAILKDNVTSPAGTTIEGIAALEEAGFRDAILKASRACIKRAEEL